MAYSVIDKVYTIFIDVMTGSSNGYGKPTFYNTDSHTSFIELTVTNGSKEFNMTEFSYMFTVEKPDGTKYTNEYTTKDKSKLVIPVDAQMISCTGNCNAQLYVNKEVDGVNKTLTMVEFNYTVYKGLHEGLISESVDFDNVYIKILNKLDYIINNGADLTDEQAQQLADAYKHSQSPHAPANIVETMHTEIGEAIDAHHKKVALSASQVGSYEGTDITVKPSNEGLTKDIVIKGKTLQNIQPKSVYEFLSNIPKENYAVNSGENFCEVTVNDFGQGNYYFIDAGMVNFYLLKPNTKYTALAKATDGIGIAIMTRSYEHSLTSSSTPFRNGVATITTNDLSSGAIGQIIYLTLNNTLVGKKQEVRDLMLLEGDYTQEGAYIPPYFEGIKSVGEPTPEGGTKIMYGSCGKNLFDVSNSSEGLLNVNTGELYVVTSSNTTDYIKVEKGKNYVVSGEGGEIRGYYGVFYDCSKKYVAQKIFSKNASFTFEQDGYFRFSYATGEDELPATNIQIEEGTEATAYEPYQEDIKDATVPIKGGLKALPNGTHDRVFSDANTHYKVGVNQCVGEYTFTGNETWSDNGAVSNEKTLYFYTDVLDSKMKEDIIEDLVCDTLPVLENFSETVTVDSIMNAYPYSIRIRISRDKLETPDVEGFKKWLKANPTTVWYALKSPLEHTLDTPSVGNVKTYEGATHVFSKHDFKPTISFSTDFVPLTSDAKQYCTADGNKNFILPDVASLQDSNALEIHLFVKMLANATLSFPSNILWNDLAKMNEVTKGSTAEFVFTYIKTAEGGSWLGTVVPHK